MCLFIYGEKQKSPIYNMERIMKNIKYFELVSVKIQKSKPVINNENIECAALGYFTSFSRISTKQVE